MGAGGVRLGVADGLEARGEEGVRGVAEALDRGADVAWLGRYRRHSRDYERTTESSEAVTDIAMVNLMSKRLARLQN